MPGSATKRDPRINPQPGDVLRKDGWEYSVFGRSPWGAVIYTLKCGGQSLNTTQRVPIEEWIAVTADAEVMEPPA